MDNEATEPELHVFESDNGRFVLADGSDPLAAIAALLGIDKARLDYLRGETPEENRARLDELEAGFDVEQQ